MVLTNPIVVTYPLKTIAVTYPLKQEIFSTIPKGKTMAYGTNAPNGLRPVKKLDGSAWTGQTTSYPVASAYGTALFKGDPVTVLADGTLGIATAGSAAVGVFWGVQFIPSTGGLPVNSPNWVASTATFGSVPATAFVIDDPNVVFTIQETNGAGAAGTPIALADVGLNANFAIGTGNATTGNSGASLNNTTEADTATLNLKILALDGYPGNVVGAFANWLVTLNNHRYRGGVTGA
jgi:hypothetical protein